MARVSKVRGKSFTKKKSGLIVPVDKSPILLPEEPNRVSDSIFDFIIAIFGLKGIGKSSLAARLSMTKAIVFMLERRRRNLSIVQLPDPNRDEPPLTVPRIRSYFKLLAKKYGLGHPGRDADDAILTPVIDTIDQLYNLYYKFVLAEMGLTEPRNNNYGADYVEIKTQMIDDLNILIEAELNPVYISHAKLKPIADTTTGTEVEWYLPTAAKGAMDFMTETVDIAIFYGLYERRRFMTIDGSDQLWRSSGVEGKFLDKKGNKIAMIPAGSDADTAARNLIDAFNNDPPKGSITVEQYHDIVLAAQIERGEVEEEIEEEDDDDIEIPTRKKSRLGSSSPEKKRRRSKVS